MEISEFRDELIDWIKDKAVSICNVNIVSADDLLKLLEGRKFGFEAEADMHG